MLMHKVRILFMVLLRSMLLAACGNLSIQVTEDGYKQPVQTKAD